MSTVIETGIDYSRIKDVKYMRSYLMRFNDDLRYMLTNLDEDNLDAASLSAWQKLENSVISMSRTAKELGIEISSTSESLESAIKQRADEISLCLTKGSVTSTISISTDVISITAERLKVISDNFTLDGSSLSISGEIHSNVGSLGNFTIKTENGSPYLDGSGCTISGGTMEGTTGYFKTFRCAGTSASSMSHMLLDDCSINIRNCRISTKGMTWDGQMKINGKLKIADYNEDTDSYSRRSQCFVDQGLKVHSNIWVQVYSGTSNSGLVQCYSVYSSIEGGEYSDRRLKTDIEGMDPAAALSFIREMQPVRYRLKGEEEYSLGFIAQDITALQERYMDIGAVSETEDGYMALSYERFIPLMAAAIQETDGLIHGSY